MSQNVFLKVQKNVLMFNCIQGEVWTRTVFSCNVSVATLWCVQQHLEMTKLIHEWLIQRFFFLHRECCEFYESGTWVIIWDFQLKTERCWCQHLEGWNFISNQWVSGMKTEGPTSCRLVYNLIWHWQEVTKDLSTNFTDTLLLPEKK